MVSPGASEEGSVDRSARLTSEVNLAVLERVQIRRGPCKEIGIQPVEERWMVSACTMLAVKGRMQLAGNDNAPHLEPSEDKRPWRSESGEEVGVLVAERWRCGCENVSCCTDRLARAAERRATLSPQRNRRPAQHSTLTPTAPLRPAHLLPVQLGHSFELVPFPRLGPFDSLVQLRPPPPAPSDPRARSCRPDQDHVRHHSRTSPPYVNPRSSSTRMIR